MLNLKPTTKLTVVFSLVTALVIFCSWTGLHTNESPEALPVQRPDEANVNALLLHTKIKVTPLEKQDIIVLSNGQKIPCKSTEVRVLEIKYLDAKGKMPVRIVSIRRQ